MDAYSMTVTGASALPRTCSSVAISDGGGTTAVWGAALGGVGWALPAVVVLAVVPVVGGVTCGPALDGGVPVSAALCVGVLGLAGWAFASGEVFVAVLAVGSGAGAVVPPGGTSRFRT